MKPSKDFSTRYAAAKQARDAAEPYIKEIYKHCCPGRENEFDRSPQPFQEYETTVYHSLPEELAADLAADLVTYYTPSEDRWSEYEVTTPVPEDQVQAVEAKVNELEEKFFDLIQNSNYNDIAPQWGFEAATHGTPSLWLTQNTIFQGLHFEVVPPAELLIVPGFRGINDRFREMTVAAEHLEAQLAGEMVVIDDPGILRKMEKPGQTVQLCYGFWLDWSDPARPQWMQEITVDGEAVSRRIDETTAPTVTRLGDITGACPLLVGRFFPQPGKPWGRGPGWRALPDIRSLDEIEDIHLTHMEESLKRTLIYPDDGLIDLEGGLESGRAYPASRGFTRDQIYEMMPVGKMENTYFTREDYEERIRRLFYQDGPRQRGDTPPTATQWIDEQRRVQRRLGKPSAPLWTEMILPMVQRVEKIGVDTGRLDTALSHAGEAIKVQPLSPLQKAQKAGKVTVARGNLEMAFGVFQEQVGQVIDMPATMRNIIDATGDDLTVVRTEPVEPPTNETAPEGQQARPAS